MNGRYPDGVDIRLFPFVVIDDGFMVHSFYKSIYAGVPIRNCPMHKIIFPV